MPKRKLQDKNVVITGGGGGLGAALGQEFVYSGCNVALLDIEYERAVLAADGISRGRVLPIACDVTSEDSCRQALSQAADELGGIDILVNNAGLAHRSSFTETDLAVLERTMNVNFWGSVMCTKLALPDIIARRGAIVVITSTAAYAPLLGRTGYAASKHALHGLFTTLSAELRKTGVDVLVAAPSFIDTPFRERTIGGDGKIATYAKSSVGKMTPPADVAERIVWAVERRRSRLIIGSVGRLTRYLSALAPGLYERMMTRSLQSEFEK